MGWWENQKRAWARDWSGLAENAATIFRVTARLSTYAILFGALYWFWPTTRLWDRPLGSITAGELLMNVGCAAAGMLLIQSLFSPNENSTARAAWTTLGIAILLFFLGL